jgi:T-complex protein 1 subunit beta
MKMHPQTIISGWRIARDVAKAKLLKIARDNSSDQEKFKGDLLNIAKTTLSSKLLTQDKQHFA